MSSDATEGAGSVLTALAEQLQPEDASLAGAAVSNLLGATEAVARNEDSGSEGAAVAVNSAAAERAVQLSNVLERVTVSLGSSLVPGERPAVVETERFKLSVHAGRADQDLGGESTAAASGRRRLIGGPGGASVTFEPGALDDRSTSMTQVVEWDGAGPHFWAGSNLTTSRAWASSHQDATTMGSSVLTVSFFNATGGKVEVDGLTQPAVVGLVVPEHKATGGIRQQLEQLTAEDLRKRAKGYNVSAVESGKSKQELIELLLDVPEIALVASAVYCAYWDTVNLQWQVDGAGRFHRVGDAFVADCSTSHFTGAHLWIDLHLFVFPPLRCDVRPCVHCAVAFADFVAFMGPLPQMNRLGDLSDLPSNPTGMRVTLIMLGLIIFMVVFGMLEYRRLARGAEAASSSDKSDIQEQEHKARHDRNVAYFAQYRRLYDDPSIPWTHRALIGLRTRWLVGGCL